MGIFADLTVKENLLLAARKASNAAQMDAARPQWIFRLFPAVESSGTTPQASSAAVKSRWWPWPAPSSSRATCSSWTSPARAWPRHHQQHDRGVRPAQKSGVTIPLVEQNIHFAKRLGDNVAVMDNGRVVHAGSMAALAADEALQQSLLGLSL